MTEKEIKKGRIKPEDWPSDRLRDQKVARGWGYYYPNIKKLFPALIAWLILRIAC